MRISIGQEEAKWAIYEYFKSRGIKIVETENSEDCPVEYYEDCGGPEFYFFVDMP